MLKPLNDLSSRHPVEDSQKITQEEMKAFLLKYVQRTSEEPVRQTQNKTQVVVLEHVKESSQNTPCRQDNVLDAKVKAFFAKYVVSSVSDSEPESKKEIETERLSSPTDVSISTTLSTPNLGSVRDVISPLSSILLTEKFDLKRTPGAKHSLGDPIPAPRGKSVQITSPLRDAQFCSFARYKALPHWSTSPGAFDGEVAMSMEVMSLEDQGEDAFSLPTLGRHSSSRSVQ